MTATRASHLAAVACGGGHHKGFPWPPRGFLGVKLARTQNVQRPRALLTSPTLGGAAGMAGHDGTYLSGQSRTSAAGASEAHSTRWIDDADWDTRAGIAARVHPSARADDPELRGHSTRLDAAMAAAAVCVGVLSGAIAGGITWWVTGEHPHLAALHHHGQR
ncbi:hypothetical protein [Mycobacteroides abscessus]|uniref:hypothetical protein n=1 Tax=Mycobacteroides abscessus TaxID=36809 RepID=UPI0009270A21|nr:hypothetical protein [Mycobacteroides abscessus]SIL07403.1 Uncharacterised protein [Mycobacteroides abscessus subsp. abscessus]SIN09675.1 Uncharacterised protein [Mycobacteroides abscessus subsp. abscessus]SIN20369.1 Uncharacterised protein [Mycobacteroides abscessus subsp. abscessus]